MEYMCIPYSGLFLWAKSRYFMVKIEVTNFPPMNSDWSHAHARLHVLRACILRSIAGEGMRVIALFHYLRAVDSPFCSHRIL